ncbi:hypothetical protein F383_20813 [Gossypium arboreum]|uniref:TF-B3 domain-containing protein n=1 Tax=Gossypium arboreum TaxID=29729 RepID=A0A0B0MRM5_GOSAR|nr:hypothetical protein F383_20813 [Gossypium arboreum]
MDRRVKKEAEEIPQRTMSFAGRRLKSAGEEDFILALSTHTPTLNPSSSEKKEISKKANALTERKQKRKKCQSETIIKPAVSDCGEKKRGSMKNKDVGDGRCIAEIKSPAMICAEEIQSNLEPEFPSFAKSLVRSHVGSCFWMPDNETGMWLALILVAAALLAQSPPAAPPSCSTISTSLTLLSVISIGSIPLVVSHLSKLLSLDLSYDDGLIFEGDVTKNVVGKLKQGLPGMFCKTHLPRKDTTITLEDESGNQFHVKYYADKTGLSAGWRQFCSAHNLLEGDVLVFQLVEPTKFKNLILGGQFQVCRISPCPNIGWASTMSEGDEVAFPPFLTKISFSDLPSPEDDAETGPTVSKSTKRKRPKSLPLASVRKKNKRSGLQRLSCNVGQPAEQSENDSEEVGSEVLEGFKRTVSAIQFKDITSFENILVDGLVIDPELSEDIRSKYYQLCCSQNAFLHENIIQGISFKFKVGIISETVNIADAIRTCKLTTSRDEFDSWDRTLKAFELLGMNVGFLRTRLHRLVNLAFESEGAAETRRYFEAKAERDQTENEIRNLEAKLTELKDASKTFGFEIESLQSKAETNEFRFEKEVKAPW